MAPGDRRFHFQAVLDRYQAERRLPSIIAGVLDGPELAWVGTAGAETTSDTQFRIGSITKVMTAVLVMQCRDDGLLDLDDPIKRFVPETGYASATVRQLLAHVSGMQSEPVGPWWERSPGVPVDDLLATNDGSGAVFGAGSSTSTTATSATRCSARRWPGCVGSRGSRWCRSGCSARSA